MSWRGVARWSGFSLAAVAALGSAFTLGVVAGAGSTPVASPPEPQALLDDAAGQIAGNSLKPVDRKALDAAAMKAMLSAAGDRWGSWGAPTPIPDAAVTTAMLTPTVGQITVPGFRQGTGRQVRAAVAALHRRQATGIVLDLRGNPGGLLLEAVETASAFLDGGHVVTYSRRDELPQRLDAIGSGDTSTDVVVLVDGRTASAAEVVAGSLQDRGRAVIVGSRTFGKGSVQEPHRLSDGSSLALTVARYALPSGRSVEGVGIEPDIHVVTPRAMVGRAIEVLIGLRADTSGSG